MMDENNTAKDIFDALMAGNKSLDSAFRLYIAAQYMADELDMKLDMLHILNDLIFVEERVIALMARLNNEI